MLLGADVNVPAGQLNDVEDLIHHEVRSIDGAVQQACHECHDRQDAEAKCHDYL